MHQQAKPANARGKDQASVESVERCHCYARCHSCCPSDSIIIMSSDPSCSTPESYIAGDGSATSVDDTAAQDEHHSSSPASTPGNNHVSTLFFADATLDLSEAHDMAETPEPQRVILGEAAIVKPSAGLSCMEMPTLAQETTTTMTTTSPMTSSDTTTATTTPPPPIATSNMHRITSDDVGGLQRVSHYPPRRPRRPRDISWAISWILLVPPILTITSLFPKVYDTFTLAAQWSVFYCILLAYGATVVLTRLLYRTMGGGDGDDARHKATHVILLCTPISVAIYLILTILLFTKTPRAALYAVLPLTMLVRSLLQLKHWKIRQLFFQALVCMALDILSRSLRRSSVYRMTTAILGVQVFMVVWWKLAVFGAISSHHHHDDGGGSMMVVLWVVLALVAGKWLTGTVARILGFIASGGIAHWFLQQSTLMEERVARQEEEQQRQLNNNAPKSENSSDASADYNVGYTTHHSSMVMPEEYRTADASIYQSVLDMDEGIDDDFVEDDAPESVEWINTSGSTCKSFLITAVTTSFGSVVRCGLLGGLAQFVWSVVRNADSLLQHHHGFRGMPIGQDARRGVSIVLKIATKANVMARSFVRSHSDLAMCHVAAYNKSYRKAASDVMILVDASGMLVRL